MASIVQRGKKYSVVYNANGKQVWESGFFTKIEAQKRKTEIEYEKNKGIFISQNHQYLEEYLQEYVDLYGKNKWSFSTYASNTGLIKNYINPNVGKWQLSNITTKMLDGFFIHLTTMKAIHLKGRSDIGLISQKTQYEIYAVLRSAFNQAVIWEYIGKNPIAHAIRPAYKKKRPHSWDPDTAKKALSLCDNTNLKVCIHLALACSMRLGEIQGLRWKCINFGKVDCAFKDAKLHIEVGLQRVNIEAMNTIHRSNDIKYTFPVIKPDGASLLVLKTPKTESSVRTVWIPPTLAEILWCLKQEQETIKTMLGSEYEDYDLVIAQNNGRPVENNLIYRAFKELIEVNNLPKVIFHSLRHTSTTFKLLITNGDIKSIQGDNGHTKPEMVVDTYAEILDENRKKNAEQFEREFYGKQNDQPNVGFSYQNLKELYEWLSKDPEMVDKLTSMIKEVNL